MWAAPATPPQGAIIYPDSDSEPMADDTKQVLWLTTLRGNLCALLGDEADVSIAPPVLWDPGTGDPAVHIAAAVVLASGRTGRRPCQHWQEGSAPVSAAFHLQSSKEHPFHYFDRLDFYDTHGVEEYYVYDPEGNRLLIYVRQDSGLRRVRTTDEFVSPHLGLRFVLAASGVTVHGRDGRRAFCFEEFTERQAQDAPCPILVTGPRGVTPPNA